MSQEFEKIFRNIGRLDSLKPAHRIQLKQKLRRLYKDTFDENKAKNLVYVRDPSGERHTYEAVQNTVNYTDFQPEVVVDGAGDIYIKTFNIIFDEGYGQTYLIKREFKFSATLKSQLEKTSITQKIKKSISSVNLKEKYNTLKDNVKGTTLLTQVATTAAFGAIVANAQYLMGLPRSDQPYGLKPEMIVGPVPLYSIQQSQRAKSDRKLKDRALGDVFLAHQKGNKDILRIDGTLTGPLKYFYIWMLLQLQKTSEGQSVNVSEGKIDFATALTELESKSSAKSNVLNYEQHRTFPIITQFQILTNMYLQTIEWHRTVEDGQDVIKYHLLFRKWEPPTKFEVFNSADNPNIIGSTGFGLDTEQLGIARKWMEVAIDATWKMIRTYGEIYGHVAIGNDGSTKQEIDRESLSSIEKLLVGYKGGLFGLW